MMEHSGTHIDALCHQANCLKVFGNVDTDSVETPYGFKQLGIEHVPPLVTRGVLLDLATWKGQTPLPRHYSITADELIACAKAQNVSVEKGDVLLVRTGYDTLWHDEETYLQAAGVGKSATLWAAERGVVAVGADNMAWDAPNDVDPDTGANLFAPRPSLDAEGHLHHRESRSARAGREQAVHVCVHRHSAEVQGATGSPIRPIALV